MSSAPAPLLEVDDLATHYPVTKGVIRKREVGAVRAVDGVSFQVARGEILGVVGESGCGKSTLARTILGREPVTRGDVRFKGESIPAMSPDRRYRLRREMQIVFQDPFSAFNPRLTIERILLEPFQAQPDVLPADQWHDRIIDLMERVGLDPRWRTRRPTQMSGGQLQRVGIARALALEPELLICDEPVSALDVSIQAQVVNLLMDLQQETGIALLFIAHDLAVVRNISDRVAIMYLGKIVELGEVDDVYDRPRHPYTRSLLSAVPVPDPDAPPLDVAVDDELPSNVDRPSGCPFHPRCWKAEPSCVEEEPLLHIEDGRHVACHFPENHPRGTETSAVGA